MKHLGAFNSFIFFMIGLKKPLMATDDIVNVDIRQESLESGMANLYTRFYIKCHQHRQCQLEFLKLAKI